ncbi:hypothetical protein SEA_LORDFARQUAAD_55 [Gordonia phage LordFarquaad]|uniref:Uncharacterized protein n=3 Tax=Attisvirus attis TaxID=2169707 RepID=A0A142K8U5_9CAUD|nr:hypothetical protein SEA_SOILASSASSIN_53 [Gordonia phage SoilAssassin]YP_009595811.1 hypothetical protein FDH00_gp53 [Gordonia phage Attis]AMS02454.1 hypothetical protein SEA_SOILASSASSIN_53 [Gordonia phage SoilAssassin]AMS02528.1 hypothetical protein SEA_ATTIS_53 [Gordonia phage Attis]QDF18375.1 hypothetical protein SEA_LORDFARQUAAD_55 [Gordonia phage LordFarquaad]
MSSAPPALALISRAAGDFPPDRPTTFTDDYGRSQVLVPIEQLQEAEAHAQRASATADRLAAECDRLTTERDAVRSESSAQRQSYGHLSAEFATALTQLRETRDLTVWLTDEIGENADGATLIDLVRRYADEQVAERDRWQEKAEEARARWTSPIGPRERWVGETAEPIPFPRPYNDLHQIQVDYLRAIECSSSGPTPEERQERRQKVFEAAMSLVYEVTHLRAQVADLQADLADERVVDAVVIDHTDPEQIRRAAGVLEGLGMDRGVSRPENYWMSPSTLRRRAELAER